MRALVPSLLCAGLAPAAIACTTVAIEHPPRGAIIAEATPDLVWTPVAGATAYRVQIESRVPNGRVVASVDLSTASPALRITRPLADEFAAVKVLVTTGCDAATALPVSASGPAFFIDPRPSCPAPNGLTADGGILRWTRHPPADASEIAIFDTIDGRLLGQEAGLPLTHSLARYRRPYAVSLRNRCGPVRSVPAYRVFPAS